jgi:hypothetical protein
VATPDRRWRRLSAFLWIVVPLLGFGALEAGMRARTVHQFLRAESVVAEGGGNVIFIGTSRVACSISPPVFEREMELRHGRRVRAINAGRGYTTMLQHELLLRRLFESCPDHMRGVEVWIEAAHGFASAARPEPAESWFFAASPDNLFVVLAPEDLGEVWSSELDLENRFRLSFQALTGGSRILSRRSAVWRELRHLGLSLARRLLDGEAARGGADLVEAGGIVADIEFIARARQMAAEIDPQERRARVPTWKGSVVERIVDLVRRGGGRPLFFDIPTSPSDQRHYDAAVMDHNRRTFQAEIRLWGVPYVQARFSATEDDFPDNWHLRASRQGEYTRALVAAWPPP